jgi:hypothetical protein
VDVNVLLRVGDVLIVAGFGLSIWFVARYWIWNRWEVTGEGRHIMLTIMMITLLLGLGTFTVIFGDYPFRELIRFLLMLLINAVLIGWHILLSRGRSGSRRN